MASSPSAAEKQVGLLVLEADSNNSVALKQILDSEGWRVRLVPDVSLLHTELKTGEYSLVIANIELVGLESPTFLVLRELAGVSADRLIAHMSKDKKVREGRITLILPRRIGEAFVMKDTPVDELRDFLDKAA